MIKILCNISILLSITLQVSAHESHLFIDKNTTTVKIKSVRSILGTLNPIEHTRGQLRTGYITLQNDTSTRTSAYALGGHFHFDTKRWYGWRVGLSAYTVLNLGIRQNPSYTNSDFFDSNGKSFPLLTEAYIDGKWGNTELKLGRQILNTPHANSDDIRMTPNYYEAYTFTYKELKDITFTTGYIRAMAGWENGIDSSKFVNIGKTLGTASIDGIYYASASYDGINDLTLSAWYYHYADIANLMYLEAAYESHIIEALDITFGLQYDASHQTGIALLQEQNARTFGASVEFVAEELGIHILAAYNKDTGSTGASSLNLGGGTLFTSMEDQTLDAMGQAGESWIIGLGYHFEAVNIDGLNIGLAYGSFKADDASLYQATEVDAILKYDFQKSFSVILAYANVDFQTIGMTDYSQVRIITNYNF